MKICFLLQRRFAYIGHALALILKEKYGVTDFCGYVSLRSGLEFLKSQKDIQYTGLLLDENVHNQYKDEPLDLAYLKELEKNYGLPNLWRYIEMDRTIRHGQLVREYPHDASPYSHEEMMRLMQVKIKAILKFLKEEKPDVIIFSVIADLSALFLYQAAKKFGIKILLIKPSRIQSLHTLTEDYRYYSHVDKTFNELQNGEMALPEHQLLAENFLKNFRAKPSPYSYRDTPAAKPTTRKKQFAFLRPRQAIVSLKWTAQIFTDYFRNKYRQDPYTVKPWHYIIDTIKRKARVFRGFDDLYDEPNFNEYYVFFPLQAEPEMDITLPSQFYTDQNWLIQQVARALPIYFKIYVKEHPAMYGYRPRNFYKKLKKIPNVKLIRPTETGFNLIQNAKIITTLVGTSGWEGMLLKKPVITFGDVFYNKLPMAKKCDNINDLPWLIKEQLENFIYDEKSLVNYITAIYKESADVDLIKIWEMEGGSQTEKHKEQLSALANLIASKLNP
ncbi:MAG: hypothetical protein UW81_C0004G0016 [Candidatus Giovannonibacteria bacterium GW2011_GWC2_44_9]|uniref:Capsule polysaccharide biosynthesis protein n=3 Tax=Candidatus Giovannoniibacteriota TaxID=1752738 RepID=A0A0G1L6M5_9BACT|nr:MAG: hypothetical protein UW49_C0001G0028 [Candidatus Giovannonibacteria bacterium GW2011_GWB1_44_23]KKT64302.1 MAG: hypothetical protein UW57_C0001G0029 [Candidatus Giovannonibacteria bacterium GW2011_GWA1_44_29]KKT84255.1 MAG: hypothetical protein UW81_C0004G0016 [Candidatus Giovannonibacteria bacterium GW2011_GWC2_44_9]KKT92029.1 MAG: hypothetical protein UW93_C0001G0028 [Parcubacteria group bacterium GW2011_GWC1_45_13]